MYASVKLSPKASIFGRQQAEPISYFIKKKLTNVIYEVECFMLYLEKVFYIITLSLSKQTVPMVYFFLSAW